MINALLIKFSTGTVASPACHISLLTPTVYHVPTTAVPGIFSRESMDVGVARMLSVGQGKSVLVRPTKNGKPISAIRFACQEQSPIKVRASSVGPSNILTLTHKVVQSPALIIRITHLRQGAQTVHLTNFLMVTNASASQMRNGMDLLAANNAQKTSSLGKIAASAVNLSRHGNQAPFHALIAALLATSTGAVKDVIGAGK